MQDADQIEKEISLKKLRKLCKLINIVLVVFLILLCIYWIFAISFMLLSYSQSQQIAIRNDPGLLNIFFYFLHGVTIIALLAVFIRIFSSAAKGESPFVMNQVKRLRIVAALLLVYAVVDSAVSCNSALIQYGAMNYGYVSTNDSAIVAVNFTPFAASAIIFAFSFVFKYGVLLQEFSDDVI